MMLLHGQTALITGASRGIGLAVAWALGRQGAQLVLNAASPSPLEEARQALEREGIGCLAVAGDVSQPETARSIVEAAMARRWKINILINNAGINLRVPFLELDHSDWQRVFDINLNGAFHMLQAVLPLMIENGGGSVVNISSSASKTPHPNAAAAYGASKGAMNALTRQLAYDMAKHQIRVNAVCPGPVETDMSHQWTPEYQATVVQKIPLGRLGRPEEVADAVLFLASPMSSFMTGETININGGAYMD